MPPDPNPIPDPATIGVVSKAFVKNIVDRLGITKFYSSLFKGIKTTFVEPFFGRER